MLRRLGVRGKILATLAVPIFVLVLAAGFISWGALQEAAEARQTSALVDSLEVQDTAGSAVATERGLAFAALNDVPGAMDALVEAQEQTDEALDGRDAALRELDLDALSVNVQDAVAQTIDDRIELDDLQSDVTSRQILPAQALQRYSEVIERALDVPRSLSAVSTDEGLVRRLNAYTAMDEAMLANTYERALLSVGLYQQGQARGEDDLSARETTELAQISQQMSAAISDTDDHTAAAQEAVDRLGLGLSLPTLDEDFAILRTNVEYLNPSAVDPEVAAASAELSQQWIDAMQPVRDQVRDETVTYAGDLSGNARNQAIGTMLATFGIVLLSVVIAVVIARRIVNPLRRLTAATADVRDRLPQMVEQMAVPGQNPGVDLVQVPVESSDEIGRLANAFNEVNETTMVVARQQAALRGSIAEMFVNVARRDQVLLNRQLAFLDELERSEEDPNTLSNLFRLDHLATRMRRNAESLLVLAGIDSGRRVRQPMPVSDVIRTASSEIELYDRVRLNLQSDPHMLGHNALTGAHLLAELLENATMFSEPHTPVEVTTTRDARGVVVAVRDHGLGMSAEEIVDANAKVASAAATDAVGAQRLGLFVVGRLANRLNAQVVFGTGFEGRGTLVTVVLPNELFLADEALPLPQPTDPLEAATQRSAAQLSVPVRDEYALPAPAEESAPAPAATASAASAPAAPSTAPQVPTSAPAPVAQPVGLGFGLAEPEAPVAEPVDIDALTDGTTSAGMPRRRRSDGETPTEAIVLPPLVTPHLDESLPEADDAPWTPPQEVAPSERSLPSRHRAATPVAAEPVTLSGALPLPEPERLTGPLDVEQRAGLFSNFRSMDRLAESPQEGTLQLDAVSEDPADIPLGFGTGSPAPAPAPAAAPAPEAPAPVARSAWAADEPAAPASSPAESTEPEQDYAALPAFEDLMSDLPTRRGDAAAHRKRGLFGRKPAADEPAVDAATAAEPFAPGPVATTDPLAGRFAPEPERSPRSFDEAVGSPSEPAPPRSAPVAPAAPSLWGEPAGPSVPEPARPEPVRPERATAYRAPEIDHVPYQPGPAEPAPQPVQESPEDTRPTPTAYGESVLPLRSTSRGADDPLDPHYVPDTVEARSEWMASAVLYEEMSTLLQRGVFQEGNVTTTDQEPTYQPQSMPSPGAGLARRSRGAEQPPRTDRFTAQIERDPEQLRARLSAFQTATARGRSATTGGGVSTDAARP
jgi:HAMP domain-containing protein